MSGPVLLLSGVMMIGGLWPWLTPPVRGRVARSRLHFSVRGPLERIGAVVCRIGWLDHWIGSTISQAALGGALLVAVGGAVLAPPLGAMVPVVLALLVVRRRRHSSVVADAAVIRGLPDIVDVIALGVSSGLTVRNSLERGGAWMPEPFHAVFATGMERVAAGEPLAEALDWCGRQLGERVRPVLRVLIAAERDGAELLPALERAAAEARRRRRVHAEERARKVPVVMLFPLVLCVLPAFALLTIVPLLLGTLTDLELPG